MMRSIAPAALISLCLCAPAQAEPLSDGLVTESDVGLAFDYLREAMSAAFQGREAAPPEALMQRAEVIAEEAKRRGEVAARAALDAIEREIREGMRAPRSERSSGAI
jgi:hypothetical protein